jgi:hypothetical protein
MRRRETNPMLERHHFSHDLASGVWSMTEGPFRTTGRAVGAPPEVHATEVPKN